MTPFQRRLAQAAVLAPLLVLASCGGSGESGNGAAMDSNLAAKADEIDEAANSRANAMAGGMMSDAGNAMAGDNGGDDNVDTPAPNKD